MIEAVGTASMCTASQRLMDFKEKSPLALREKQDKKESLQELAGKLKNIIRKNNFEALKAVDEILNKEDELSLTNNILIKSLFKVITNFLMPQQEINKHLSKVVTCLALDDADVRDLHMEVLISTFGTELRNKGWTQWSDYIRNSLKEAAVMQGEVQSLLEKTSEKNFLKQSVISSASQASVNEKSSFPNTGPTPVSASWSLKIFSKNVTAPLENRQATACQSAVKGPDLTSERVIRVFRVEGTGNQRLWIDQDGNVDIPKVYAYFSSQEIERRSERILYLNFGVEARARKFLKKRLKQFPHNENIIKSFEVKHSFLDNLRAEAIPEYQQRNYPDKPLIADRGKGPSQEGQTQFGLKSKQIEVLRQSIVPKSAILHK